MKSNEVYSGETQLNSLPQIDLSAILGTWINSNQETEWIRKFTITQEGEQVFINSYAGSSPEDWGKIEVTTYVDNHGQTGFSAQYNLDRVEVLLASNTNKVCALLLLFSSLRMAIMGPNATAIALIFSVASFITN